MERVARTSPGLASTQSHADFRGWWIVAAILILLIGALAGWLLRPVIQGPNAADINFARDMSAHHEQAVEMALIMLDRSTDEELRQFALDIILTQRTQIGQMQGWLSLWDEPLAGSEPPMAGMGEMMGMATEAQIDQLRTLPVAEAETLFLQLMTRHHEGGVAMAESTLSSTSTPVTSRLAQSIIQSQQSEMEYMMRLLAERGAEPLPPLEHGSEEQDSHQ